MSYYTRTKKDTPENKADRKHQKSLLMLSLDLLKTTDNPIDLLLLNNSKGISFIEFVTQHYNSLLPDIFLLLPKTFWPSALSLPSGNGDSVATTLSRTLRRKTQHIFSPKAQFFYKNPKHLDSPIRLLFDLLSQMDAEPAKLVLKTPDYNGNRILDIISGDDLITALKFFSESEQLSLFKSSSHNYPDPFIFKVYRCMHVDSFLSFFESPTISFAQLESILFIQNSKKVPFVIELADDSPVETHWFLHQKLGPPQFTLLSERVHKIRIELSPKVSFLYSLIYRLRFRRHL